METTLVLVKPDGVQRGLIGSILARFETKGRYSTYLKEIPTYTVTAPMPALRGLRAVLGYR